MTRKTYIPLLIIVLLAVLLVGPLTKGFWTILVLTELWNFDSKGWMGYFSSAPATREVSYSGPSGRVNADLYLRKGGRNPGILLNHGVIDTGKDDPRLKRFAEILSRAGFIVLVPDFAGMRSFHISPSDPDEIQAAFMYLLGREEVLPNSCGLFGFSYGAGPTILASCRPPMNNHVRFLVSFGGYYDLKNVLSFIATGSFDYKGKRFRRNPQEYGKWVFLANNLDLVQSPEDRLVLRRILDIRLREENAPIDRLLSQLGGEGRNILNLLSHRDPAQTQEFIRRLPLSVQGTIEALSVSHSLKNLRADLILAHGEDDDLIPYTESLRLAEAAPDPRKVHLQILKSISHVDPEQRPFNLQNFIWFYLPESWKLFRVVYQLMSYR